MGLRLKMWALPKTEAGKDACAPHFCMHGPHEKHSMCMCVRQNPCPRRMENALGAWLAKSMP